ncbi:baculoviral IAP repeat-containing protein 3-like isoform X2 [Mercenaria mercenaria]|uniref:baculoviral IAP repeat-containing protein 3-like isoform X2 n=1 Tax=Mercenaria mercenaria TaxID=6596 RepID=UPI00234F693B|nr:baculoviral IAP repeat-containing protein 3-like isoform X2 [Mercenaria mercenaria]
MNKEWARLYTFKDFPQSSNASPIRLAKAGFYYIGTREDVICFSCDLRIGSWTTNDTVSEIHQRLSPHCRYLTGEDKTNIPIHGDTHLAQANVCVIEAENVCTSSSDIRLNTRERSFIIGGANGSVRDEGSRCNSDIRTDHLQGSIEKMLFLQPNGQIEYYPGITTQKPKHPDYAIKSVRLSSFLNWCPDVMEPEQLAEAGFYYTGMKNWENGDNAWIEHARWFPNCAYVKQCKGDNFVSMCRMANIDHLTANGERQNLAITTLNPEGFAELVGDQLIEDLNSTAAKLVMGMGYKQEDVENAVKVAREKYCSAELRAQYILESLLDNSYSSADDAPRYSNQISCDTDRRSPTQGSTFDSRSADKNNSESSGINSYLRSYRNIILNNKNYLKKTVN